MATMAGVAGLVLCYWQAVSQGRLPSPVQPVVRGSERPASQPLSAATVTARAAVPPQVRHPEMSAKAKTSASPTMQPVNTPLGIPVEKRTTIDGSTPQQANAPERPSTHEVFRVSTAASAEDEKLAQQWLSSTNQRPAIRVHYDAGDVLRLARLGRGVIVASSKDPANPRELYIQTASSRSPLLAPYTSAVADRFSSYSMILERAPELAQLTAGFPVYFPHGTVELAFVPDRALATAMFAEVARARRSPIDEANQPGQTIFEGELSLDGTEPRFRVLEIRQGTQRVMARASEREIDY
jgi:hypothetical protein